MKNNKGFTLVEIMSVVVILGIIAITAVVAYNKYLNDTRNKDYDFMAKSASHAAAEYAADAGHAAADAAGGCKRKAGSQDHIGIRTVTFQELYEKEYLEYPQDPSNQGKMCSGKVVIKNTENYDGLDTEKYDVTVCCANFSYIYHFPGGSRQLTTCE